MLVSPKWQTMWLESQHCSKNINNMQLSSQQTQKVLEDLRASCCSPNKAVQLEALKCWGIWINNQSTDDWKVNSVCFTAVRPLISKKLQPLYKDVDICKMKLSLMWALLVKVQNIMHLEGPQYILEVFLQSCLSWLFSINGVGCENDISALIFQLLLGIFKKSETLNGCDNQLFPPLSTDVLLSNKVFHHLADKFLNVFIHWRKVRDKNVILKLWKHFLEHCEMSCEHIPIPVWHKIFKLAGQICSEKDETVKERLSFLHSCATTLKSALSSSKFIDFGNLLTTPCEALFKKLVELCTAESEECCDLEMFLHSKEICQVLSDRSVAVGGFDLCISVLDLLEEFCLRSLFWGVWCGLVYCYKVQLLNVDKSQFTKAQMTFYRKLRGVAVNLELDRDNLHKDCIKEVEKHIEVLNIGCFCPLRTGVGDIESKDCIRKDLTSELLSPSDGLVSVTPSPVCGQFIAVSVYKPKQPANTFTISLSLVRNILEKIAVNSLPSLFNGLFSYRFITLRTAPPKAITLPSRVSGIEEKTRSKAKPLPVACTPPKKKPLTIREKDSDEEIASTPKTRSRKRAEEEERKKELENQKRKKRKSFEVIVQEIVRKNKERKTEKNSNGRRSPVMLRAKQRKKKVEKVPEKKDKRKLGKENQKPDRKLKNCKKEELQNRREKKNDGKLENYFKVITKKSGNGVKKEEKKAKKEKKNKVKTKSRCCNSGKKEGEKKGETAWKQTSLKTMMNEKSKPEKVKQSLKTRNKGTAVTVEKPKMRKESKKVSESPLKTLSPFKEVFHDHEYAKIEPEGFWNDSFERVLLAKKEKQETAKKCKKQKRDVSDVEKVEREETKAEDEKSKVEEISEPKVVEKPEEDTIVKKVEEVTILEKVREVTTVEKQEEQKEVEEDTSEKAKEETLCETLSHDESIEEEYSEIVLTPTRKAKKRVRMLDSIRPSKKLKLDEEEEKLPLEITEKENLEEKQTELKKNPSKNDTSPKAVNGMISSRALRMIALVPESTKSSQIQRDSPVRVELSKCKKPPNVDKYSRASKMLALLSGNVVEAEEVNELVEDVTSELVTTPNVKTPTSSLKSPSSIKKRRSIRFDDAKNETVVYQTDTPPSQILEEKEKCRRIKPNQIMLSLP